MEKSGLPATGSKGRVVINFDDEPGPAAPIQSMAPPATNQWAPPPPPAVAQAPAPVAPPAPYAPPAPIYQPNVMAVAAMSMNRKSPGAAVLLSLLFTGAGQVYCGRAARGVAFFFAAVFSAVLILFAVGLVLLPVVWVWAAIDAANLANRQNATLIAAMGVPAV